MKFIVETESHGSLKIFLSFGINLIILFFMTATIPIASIPDWFVIYMGIANYGLVNTLHQVVVTRKAIKDYIAKASKPNANHLSPVKVSFNPVYGEKDIQETIYMLCKDATLSKTPEEKEKFEAYTIMFRKWLQDISLLNRKYYSPKS